MKLWASMLGLALAGSLAAPACSQRLSIEVRLSDRVVEGTPLAWSQAEVLLLGRDGRLWNLAPSRSAVSRDTRTLSAA